MDLSQTTAVSLSSSTSASASSALSSCTINNLLKDIYVEGAPLETIEALCQNGMNDAFPHAVPTIEQLLLQNPGMNIYLWSTLEAPGHPSICCLLVPQGHPPILCCVDLDSSTSTTAFCRLDQRQFRWAPLSGHPSLARAHQLVCDADPSTGTEHFLLMSPLKAIQKMQSIKSVEFEFSGHNLECVLKDHGSIDAFVSETIAKIPLENTPNTQSALKWAVEEAIADRRKEFETVSDSFKDCIMTSLGFDSIESACEFDGKTKRLKILAIENTRPNLRFNQWLGSADIAISHLDSLSLLKSPVAKSQMNVIDLGGGVNSPSFVLTMALLVDFLRCLQRTDCLQCLNALMELVPYGRLAIFLAEKGYALAKGKREVKEAFLGKVYSTLLRKFRSSTLSPPACVGDFLVNFSVFAGVGGVSQVINDRSLAANKLRLDPSGSIQLQISFTGIDVYYAISPSMLQRYVSTACVPDLLIKVLSTPGNEVQVPPGHRNSAAAEDIAADNAADVDVRSDCTKQAILHLPDATLSPEGKQRAEKTLPNKEITFDDLLSIAKRSIRSIGVKNLFDPHYRAMTDRSVMIGTASIKGSSRSHAVVIDGTKGKRGIIFDPYEGFGEVERTPAGLKKLGIESFTQAYEIQRNEISKRKRAKLERDTGLPF